jgi:L-arabinokinase
MSGELPASFFSPGCPIALAWTPGRLDVMGGVADDSGSVVLEAPLASGTLGAAQRRGDRQVRLWSEGLERHGLAPHWEGGLDSLLSGPSEGYPEVRRRLTADPATAWSAYAAGVVTVLHVEGHLPHRSGLNLFLRSDVPLGAGVSSSASVEVAAMAAVCGAYGRDRDGLEIAPFCQRVENLVVGAPCGIMDTLASPPGRAALPRPVWRD